MVYTHAAGTTVVWIMQLNNMSSWSKLHVATCSNRVSSSFTIFVWYLSIHLTSNELLHDTWSCMFQPLEGRTGLLGLHLVIVLSLAWRITLHVLIMYCFPRWTRDRTTEHVSPNQKMILEVMFNHVKCTHGVLFPQNSSGRACRPIRKSY